MLSKFIVKSVMLGKGRVLASASVSMLWTSAFLVSTERGCLQVGMPRKKEGAFIYGTKRLHALLNVQTIMLTTCLTMDLNVINGLRTRMYKCIAFSLRAACFRGLTEHARIHK